MNIVYSPRHHQHATAAIEIHGQLLHEVPARAETILKAVATLGPVRAPDDHGLAPIQAIHAPEYVRFLQTIYAASAPYRHRPEAGAPFLGDAFRPRGARHHSPHPWALIGRYCFDVESPFLEGTWEAAYASAQCALTAADAVLAGARCAYALCRPPGHHASADLCGGFCYLNNAAIAARYLQQTWPGRAAILDIDYHHGNGTQEIFYSDPSVLYVSLHAHPDQDYPFFWGMAEERGEAEGLDCNLNFPLPHGTGDAEYLAALNQALSAIQAYAPRVLLVSAGFDIGDQDPSALGPGFRVTAAGFRAIGDAIAALTLPTLLIQEGGYRLDTLGQNAHAFLSAFA